MRALLGSMLLPTLVLPTLGYAHSLPQYELLPSSYTVSGDPNRPAASYEALKVDRAANKLYVCTLSLATDASGNTTATLAVCRARALPADLRLTYLSLAFPTPQDHAQPTRDGVWVVHEGTGAVSLCLLQQKTRCFSLRDEAS